MFSLSEKAILDIWEDGHNQHPIDRALTMLLPAFPDKTRDELAQFSVGKRDVNLLKIRADNFGGVLAGVADCPNCQLRLEFSIACSELHQEAEIGMAEQNHTLRKGKYTIEFRTPNSRDLAAIAKCNDASRGPGLLLNRCIVTVKRAGKETPHNTLPDSVTRALAQAIEQADPQAETLLDLTCPECGHGWSILLDIAEFLWTEIAAKARRLLQEVHLLALAYGWQQDEILELSTYRRRRYLEMIG